MYGQYFFKFLLTLSQEVFLQIKIVKVNYDLAVQTVYVNVHFDYFFHECEI